MTTQFPLSGFVITISLFFQGFKHLRSTTVCFDSYNLLSFKIIDKANSKFKLKIKEALQIIWIKPKCTTKSFSSHTFTITCVTPLFLFVFVFSLSLLHLLSLLSLTLIIGIFYCFNYICCYFVSLEHTLYHTFPFHLLFSLYPTLIIDIFYCLNYTSVLLDLIITHLVNTFYDNYVIVLCPRQFLRFI